MKIENILKEKKLNIIELGSLNPMHLPAVKVGKQVWSSAQFPIQDQRLMFTGRVGKEVTRENAGRASKACVVNCLSAIKKVIFDLDKIKRVLKMNAYVSSALGFNDQFRVVLPASELLLDIFGSEKGAHAKTVVGVFELPMKSCLQMELIVEV